MSDENTVTAQVPGATDADYVSVKLAHPLNTKDKERLGIDADADLSVGTTVRVVKAQARSLISSGYAQVDPEDKQAVKEVLGGKGGGASTQAEARDPGEGTPRDLGRADEAQAPARDAGLGPRA